MRAWKAGAICVALWAWAAAGGCGGAEPAGSGAPAAGTLVIDPVCKMEVVADPEGFRAEYAGRSHYFCSHACRDKFQADPGNYVRE